MGGGRTWVKVMLVGTGRLLSRHCVPPVEEKVPMVSLAQQKKPPKLYRSHEVSAHVYSDLTVAEQSTPAPSSS